MQPVKIRPHNIQPYCLLTHQIIYLYTTHCCNEYYIHCNTCSACLKWLRHLIKYWTRLLNQAERNPGLMHPLALTLSFFWWWSTLLEAQSTVLHLLQSNRMIWLVDFSFLNTDDHNRIALAPFPGHNDCQRDYINACYIDVSIYVTIPQW